MPKPLDPLWEYHKLVDPHNQQKMRCKLCGKEIYGRNNRLKYHIAKILGLEVDICRVSNPKVIHITNQSILDSARKRDEKKGSRLELATRSEARSMGTITRYIEVMYFACLVDQLVALVKGREGCVMCL